MGSFSLNYVPTFHYIDIGSSGAKDNEEGQYS